MDITREQRKFKRLVRSAKGKTVGLAVLCCVVSVAPVIGTSMSILAMLCGLFVSGRVAYTMYEFEKDLDELDMSDEDADKLRPDYMPLVINACICVGALIAGTAINSILGATVSELIHSAGG